MNSSYLNNSSFPSNNMNNMHTNTSRAIMQSQEYIPYEKSYIENILRFNKGKKVSIYQSFPSTEGEVFNGIIEQCGKDHVILSDPNTGNWYMLLMIYLNYIKFEEEINTIDQFYSTNR